MDKTKAKKRNKAIMRGSIGSVVTPGLAKVVFRNKPEVVIKNTKGGEHAKTNTGT